MSPPSPGSIDGGRPALGYAAVSGAAVLWAFGGTLARLLIERGASPVELVEARAWLSLLGLGAAHLILRRRRTPARTGRVGLVVVVFGLSIAAANALYYLSLSLLPVAVAITVQYTAPGLVVLWVVGAQRQRPSVRVVSALVFASAGVALLAELPAAVVGTETTSLLGIATALGSAVAFASYMVTGERVGRALGARASLVRGFAVASVFWVVVQGIRGRPDTLTDPSFWPGIVILAVATTIAPFFLFVWGLDHVDASRAGIVSTLEPLTAALLAFVWLGQTLSGWQLAGGAMVVAGIAVVQTERPPAPEVLAERAAVE